jgi:hypothetical protein
VGVAVFAVVRPRRFRRDFTLLMMA